MTRVLLVGMTPESVDFSDPGLPPGMNAEKIRAGIEIAQRQMRERSWTAELCLIEPDATAAAAEVRRMLAGARYDCVVIGGGIRLPPRSYLLFEAVINAVHTGAPDAAIAFNTSPETSVEAVDRWVKTG
jgi:hypothetical protein